MSDGMIQKKRTLFINGVLLTSSLFFSLLLAETLLRLFTPFPIHSSFSNKKAHDELGWVLSPKIKDSDGKGFRNKCYIPNPDIITIGDSHTYGYNVPREESWPEILSRMSGKTVYNFGMGGYGISQYAYLVKESIKMKPKDIIIGLYLPNDLQDYLAFNFVRFLTQQNKSENTLQKNRDQKNPLFMLAFFFKKPLSIFSIQWFYGHSALCSFLRYYLYDNYLEIMRNIFLKEKKQTGELIRYGQNTTIVKQSTQYYRNMDTTRIEIREAINHTKKIFDALIAQATDDGIRVHILFIPSKQAVFYNYARAQGFSTMCEQMRGVFEAEEALVFDFASFFNSRRVKTCYLRDLLSQKALLGIKIYPSSSDDHPTVDGYQVYAESAYRLLTNRDGGL